MEDAINIIRTAPNDLTWPRFSSWYSKNRANKKVTNSAAWKLYNNYLAEKTTQEDEIEGSDDDGELPNKPIQKKKKLSKVSDDDEDEKSDDGDDDEEEQSKQIDADETVENEEESLSSKKLTHLYEFDLKYENGDDVTQNLTHEEFQQVLDVIKESTAISGITLTTTGYRYPDHFTFVLSSKTKTPIERVDVNLPETCIVTNDKGKNITFNIVM